MPSIILRSSLLILLTVCLVLPSQAKTTSTDSLHLTKQKVRDWIQTRIAVAKLQKKMKANAAEYDDVVQEFFAKRKTLLESQGWSVAEFDEAKKRINGVTSAMDTADKLANSKADHEEQVEEIKGNDFYSDKQKEEMIKSLNMIREQQKSQFIEPTKPDWPAVNPYRSTLEKMTVWIAGNIPDPPVVE